MKYHLKPPPSKQVETKSKVGKRRIFYPLHGFILDFGGKGVCCSNLFCPRLSKTETGVTQSIMYGNHDLKVVVARFWSLTLWTQTWLHQALGFHGNNHFHYRDLTLIEPKNSFPVTCPDIFRLTDENTQIKYFPLRFLTSTAILYDSASVQTKFWKERYHFSIPPSWLIPKMHCMLLMTHAWKICYS